MTKDLLIELYRQQDRQRKKALYDLFSEFIQLNASLHFIAQMINKELGINELTSKQDIKYCRHYFKHTKTIAKARLPDIQKKVFATEKVVETNVSDSRLKEINWTNPDEVKINQIIKSKFSKS